MSDVFGTSGFWANKPAQKAKTTRIYKISHPT
jgi:hypothetical protein